MPNFIAHGDPCLFEEFIQNLDAKAFETPMMRVGKLVEWNLFEPDVMAAVTKAPKGPGGRPRFHPMLMFKILVLQKLHGLADDATSFQIADRHSFRAFLNLTAADAIPDGQTISDFREYLGPSMPKLFDVFLSHLRERHGLGLAKQGVMIDASFADVPRQRNSRKENAEIKEGKIPAGISDNDKVLPHKDMDARWTKKNHETHYGYKDHVKVDVKDKIILAAVVTPANTHDSQALDKLISEGDVVVYADSAYTGAPIEAELEAKKIRGEINEKGTRGHPLTEEQKECNRVKSKTRARVEHVFAQMTGSMKALYQRCIGFERNKSGLILANLVYNLLRFEQIKRLKLNSVA